MNKRTNDQLVVVHLHIDLIRKYALLNNRLREANPSAVAYFDKGCFYDYNVITMIVFVNIPFFERQP